VKFTGTLVLLVLTALISFAQDKDKKSPPPAPAIEILAEGSEAAFEKPFIFVARDKSNYASLQKLVKGLPDKVDFSTTAVVAVFSGMKPTAGHDITTTGDFADDPYIGARVSILASAPPAGKPVADVLTYPFKIVSVPVAKDKMIKLEPGDLWKNAAEIYRFETGKFFASAKIAPLFFQELRIDGLIAVWRHDELITCFFNLFTGDAKPKRILETASGSLKDDSFSLPRLDAGSFVPPTHYPLKVTGNFKEQKLTLQIGPSKTWSAGSGIQYEGQGKLEFTRIK
jgi:hypothetical protein